MDSLKIHQLINYYPAIGMVLGSIVLAVGLVRSNGRIRLFALRLMVFVAILTIFVVFAGEFANWDPTVRTAAANEALRNHKLMGTAAFAVTTLAGIAAYVAIRRTRNGGRDGRWALMTAFALSVAASVLLSTTVFRGRQVKWAGAVIPPTAVAGLRQPTLNQVEERRTIWHA
ncbi:MAG: hypothetical protein IPM25_14305 [Chloracidobacterium sp.]|nr:hypothetical protein [Chloracidobacterium sp.]